jgi:hypothetical protein
MAAQARLGKKQDPISKILVPILSNKKKKKERKEKVLILRKENTTQ